VRVAALYDVHAMPHALEAVLADVERDGADVVLFGGDLIGGPFARRVVELARRVPGARFVRGNAEREPGEWDRGQLTAEDLAWLASSPFSASIDGVLYVHATPRDDTTMTTVFTPDDVVREAFDRIEERVVVIGHTHHQFDRRVDDVRIVNAGSVGMPYEGEVAAFWAAVDEGEPSLRKTPFDVERAVAEMRTSDWPGAEEFVVENLLAAVSRDEAARYFEEMRTSRQADDGSGGPPG
jgi:putative phosphoesterase